MNITICKISIVPICFLGKAMQRSTGSLPSNRSVSDPELQRMVQQVQDVLPDIPAPAILKDLGRPAPAKQNYVLDNKFACN